MAVRPPSTFHHTFRNIQTEFVRKKGSSSRSLEKKWEDMIPPSHENPRNCVDPDETKMRQCQSTPGSPEYVIPVAHSTSFPTVYPYSVCNGSDPLERFRVRVGTGTEPWQRFCHMENPDRWHLGRFPPQNPAFGRPDISLQLRIWVLIVSRHDHYIYFAILAVLSPPAFPFVIRPIFVQSLSKTH